MAQKAPRLLLLAPLVLALLVLGSLTQSARGQEPTQEPTITSTPSYLTQSTLKSGNTFLYENKITTGELMIFVGEVALFILICLALFILVPKAFTQK